MITDKECVYQEGNVYVYELSKVQLPIFDFGPPLKEKGIYPIGFRVTGEYWHYNGNFKEMFNQEVESIKKNPDKTLVAFKKPDGMFGFISPIYVAEFKGLFRNNP
jgi:hypothetical protein